MHLIKKKYELTKISKKYSNFIFVFFLRKREIIESKKILIKKNQLYIKR